METATIKVVMLPTKFIHPNPNQPRKLFDAALLANLAQSIKEHGVKVPISVVKMGPDNYQLEDGERRWRAAQSIDLPELPCIIEEPKTEAERMVIQFNIQEQHEAWSPVEKAMAIYNLSQELEISLKETCALLGIKSRTADKYVAFADLVDKEAYQQSEIPIEYAEVIKRLKMVTKRLYFNELKKEFLRSDEKALENAIIVRVKKGMIGAKGDVTKIMDAFNTDPKVIDEFINNEELSSEGIFLKTRAQGAYHLRNLRSNASQIVNHIRRFMETKDVPLTRDDIKLLKEAKASLGEMIDLVEL